MRRPSASRAVALVTAILVVGGLLLMHGIEPPAATAEGHGTPVGSASHAVVDRAAAGRSDVHHGEGFHGEGHHGAAAHSLNRPGREAAATGQRVRDSGCPSCGLMGHGVLLCVAVLGAVVGGRGLRRVLAVLRQRAAASAAADGESRRRRVEGFSRVPRPPRPLWVELAVMRC